MSAQASTAAGLKIAKTAAGYRLRVVGRGTMLQSPAALAFGMQCLAEADHHFALDLSDCEYLDSTFQGCLLQLQRAFGRGPASRFSVTNPSEACRRLLAAANIDRLLNISGGTPEVVGNELHVACDAVNPDELSRHVMVCHQQLADAGGPQGVMFQKIADKIAQDLEQKSAAARTD